MRQVGTKSVVTITPTYAGMFLLAAILGAATVLLMQYWARSIRRQTLKTMGEFTNHDRSNNAWSESIEHTSVRR